MTKKGSVKVKKYYTPDEIKQLSLQEMMDITSAAATPEPAFTSDNSTCVHNLFYSWHGCLSDKEPFPKETADIIKQCAPLWEKEGIELLKFTEKSNILQILCKVHPKTSPETFAHRIKGRLAYAFREASIPVKFSRSIGFRSLGFNTSEVVKHYIDGQVKKEDLADERYREILKQFTCSDNSIDFSDAHKNRRSRYWYNLHLVIVIADRSIRITKDETFEKIRAIIPAIAEKHQHKIADFSVMPDHIHIAMQANPENTPYEIGLSFLNNLTYTMKMRYFWNEEFYVGTFSEYTVGSLGVKR